MLETVSQLLFRTIRMASSDVTKFTNRLAFERSPYLLQHKNNPIEWYPWGEEAFIKAKQDNKPIFLSVGYSTCHWCHVMERESFENERIAKILNDHFISIKVDREERPDVDRLYMSFIQATSGGGGWPMSVFLTPDLEPFFGGTYFPPDDGHGRTGFASLLNIVNDKWKNDTEVLKTQGKVVMRALSKATTAAEHPPVETAVKGAFQHLCKAYDRDHGGFGIAPKFPKAVDLNFLLNMMSWSTENGEKKISKSMLEHSLKAMSLGGIHDHIGKGFHRYSVDDEWHVPHFEKMLYDQTQLLAVYSDFSIATGGSFKHIIQDITDYMLQCLHHPEGGFYSAEDADSLPTADALHKKEGAFCVWSKAEVDNLLRNVPKVRGHPPAVAFCDFFDIQEEGNVPQIYDPHDELTGVNILRCKLDDVETAKMMTIDVTEFRKMVQDCKDILLPVRMKRPPPHLDSKMVTAWQGLAISGFSKASAAMKNPEFLKVARECAEFVETYCTDQEGHLLRAAYRGDNGEVVKLESNVPAFSDDYAFLIQGYLDLYQHSCEERWLRRAYELQAIMDQLFLEKENGTGYFISKEGHAGMSVRIQEDQDGAEPCANSVAVSNLTKLAEMVSNKKLTETAGKVIKGHAQRLSKYPFILTKMLTGFKALEDGYQRIVIVGRPEEEITKKFKDYVLGSYAWNRCVVYLNPDKKESWLVAQSPEYYPMLAVTTPTAFVCEGMSCSLPLKNLTELEEKLRSNE